MPGIRRLLVASLAALGLVAIATPSAFAAIAIYPDSMAATGASATTAYNTCPTPGTNCPANSWSTGTEPAVNSIYLRIRAVNPAIEGRAFNDAVAGSKMASLQAQVERAAEQRAELVTVDMGSNDICTDTEAEMTSVDELRSKLRRGADRAHDEEAGDPHSRRVDPERPPAVEDPAHERSGRQPGGTATRSASRCSPTRPRR